MDKRPPGLAAAWRIDRQRCRRPHALGAYPALLVAVIVLLTAGGCEFAKGPGGFLHDRSGTPRPEPTPLPPVENWPRTSIRVVPDAPEPIGRLSLAVPPGWYYSSYGNGAEVTNLLLDYDDENEPVARLSVGMISPDSITVQPALATPIVVGKANGVSMPYPTSEHPFDGWGWGSTVVVEGDPNAVGGVWELTDSDWRFELSYGDGWQTADEAAPYLEILRQILDTVSFDLVEDWPRWQVDQSLHGTPLDYPLDLITPSPHMRFMTRYWTIPIPPGWEVVQSDDDGWSVRTSAAHDPAEDGLAAGPMVVTVSRTTGDLSPEVAALLDDADWPWMMAEAVDVGDPPPRVERHGYILGDIGVRLADEHSPTGRSLRWRTRDWQASVEVPKMEPDSDHYRRYERAALLLLMQENRSYRQEFPEGYPGGTP